MTHCEKCNASHKNTVERVIRCGTCVVQPKKFPTNYRAIESKLKEKNT